MSEITRDAITAATHRKAWGRWATLKFAEKRGVPRHILRLTMQLEAAKSLSIF